MDSEVKLLGKILQNLWIYKSAKEIGFDYVLNPHTEELHKVDYSTFWGSHNLAIADLEKFIGLTNIGLIAVHHLQEGSKIPVYDIETGKKLGTYCVNKCKYCFPL